jgi:hypothetical protein
VLEVLVEEPRAKVDGPRLSEVASAVIDGRSFRRFLARDVAPNTVVRIDAPEPGGNTQGQTRMLVVVVALVMLAALALWRLRARRVSTVLPQPASEQLIAELASLDARFERDATADVNARATYQRDRADLKARIERALAEESARP